MGDVKKIGGRFWQQLKNAWHGLEAVWANLYFRFPSKSFYVIGVTGTNGKTTTVQMIGRILEEAGKKVLVSSTINLRLNGEERVNKTKMTTLESFELQRLLAEARDNGTEVAVIETSSHALDQNRVWGVDYDMAVISNVTREHLDYHEDMASYRKAKQKLFKIVEKKQGKKWGYEQGLAVVNGLMEKPEDFLVTKEKTRIYLAEEEGVTLSKEVQDLHDKTNYWLEAEEINLTMENSKFAVQENGQNLGNIDLALCSLFNVENALAAIAATRALGISFADIKMALEKITVVPGRMDEVPNERGLKIFVDYALTPDSMEKLGNFIQKNYLDLGHKLIWVFGSCGERDRGKRPMMGAIVAQFADYLIVANEDPYGEDPQVIIDEVFAGAVRSGKKKEGENAWKIMDRREAIKKALQLAQAGDVVLITGKGAEENMKIGKEFIPWNDKRVTGDLLKEL